MGGDCSTLKSCNVSRHHHTHSLAHSTRLCRFRAVSHRPMRRLPVRPIRSAKQKPTMATYISGLSQKYLELVAVRNYSATAAKTPNLRLKETTP